MRARTFTGAAVAAATLLFAGTALAEPVTISFLTHWPPETVAKLEAAAEKYKEANPDVSVAVRAVPFGDLLTTLRSQGGGAGGATIAGIYDLWLPELVRDGLVAPVPDTMASGVREAWPAGVVAAASVGGTLYGFPNEIDVYALNYNKKLFEEAGIAAPPKTWDAFLDAAAKLTKKDGDTTTQQGFGMINSWAAGVVHPFASLLASNGGELIADGKPALDSEPATQTFELYEKLIKEGYSNPHMATADANTTGPFLDNFVSGKTGMIIMANWWESALKAGMGDNFSDIATAPIPVGPSGDKPRSISYSWMTIVNANASDAEKAAAFGFLDWLNGLESGPDGASAMGDILVSMGILPSRTSDVAAFGDRLATPFLAGYVDVLADARPFPVVLGGQEFTEALQMQLEAIQFGQASAADAQSSAQADAVEILERAAR
ncbi:MAG: extracellular solute-binding protein [Bauldia sp.]|uniref:ABC transporter substrate-binding protein n=1 Tax=Bauldia sp. TaxID=2575872 RepID=UPI001D66A226|nr:extracellular solute-binding protein [Bauldia sp.]MCB1497762.1 extracellular solute-binding protein [Bauldia sp.]